MSLVYDLLELAPGNNLVKAGLGVGLTLAGITGALLVPNLGGAPMIGSEIKSVKSPVASIAGATVRRKKAEQEVGLRQFKMNAGQTFVYDYNLETTCGKFTVSLDKHHGRELGLRRKLLKTVSTPGEGQLRWKAPEDGLYRLDTFASARSRCAVRWNATWRIE